MRRLAFIAVAISTLFLQVGATLAQQSEPADAKIRVLLTHGGHNFEHEPFFAVFDAMTDIACTKAEFPQAGELLKPGLEKQYDVVVRYDMAMNPPAEQREAFKTLLRTGIGLVALHHTLCIERDWPEYAEIIGTTANKTWQEGLDMRISVVDREHPITRGIADFVIQDETYNDYRVTPNSHILLRTDHPKNLPGEIAWTRQYGKSPVVYLMLGHDSAAYRNPNFQTLMHNAIVWAAAENKKIQRNP